MPVRKHENKKNAPIEERDSAIVPPKEEANQLTGKKSLSKSTAVPAKKKNPK